MFTEYIFENKKYEVAIRDLKSTLFDIVAIENAKLSDIEMRLSREFNPEVHEELQVLYEKQNTCLKRALEISGELSDSLMELDSYSKELNKLENGNVAEMITDLGDKKIEKAYQKDVLNAKHERDEIAEKMIKTVDGLEDNYMVQKDATIENIKTVQQGVESDEKDLMANLQMPVEGNDVTFIADSEEENIAKEDSEDNEIAAESTATDVEEPSDAADQVIPEEENEVAEEESYNDGTVDENTADVEASSDATDSDIPEEEAEVDEENETVVAETTDGDTTDEDAEMADEESEAENVERVSSVNDVTNSLPEINLPQDLEVEKAESESIPQMINSEVTAPQEIVEAADEVKSVKEEVDSDSQQIVGDENAEVGEVQETASKTLEPIGNVDIPVVSDIVDRQEAIALENKKLSQEADMGIIQKLRFIKSDANVTKAIITAKKQIANLRNSRETAKALLKVKRSVQDIPIATKTMQAIDKSLENEQVMEQKLIENGLLEPATVDKQRKIEEMLEQANSLYKEGKVEEARVMYDQISILNRESQVNENSGMVK